MISKLLETEGGFFNDNNVDILFLNKTFHD